MGQQARRSNPPHGMFYRSPGAATMPIPRGIIRDISNNFYRPSLLNLLPAEALQALAGFMWISWETPGYPNCAKDTAKSSLVLYYLPTLGSTDPYVLLPTTTMIQLGCSAYAPARMEIVDDVINMSRLRGRADSSQLAPVQIMTVLDSDGAGTPNHCLGRTRFIWWICGWYHGHLSDGRRGKLR